MSHYSEQHYPPNKEFDRFYYNLFFKKGNIILDIGCSTGNFVIQDPDNITGIDIDKDGIEIAKKRGLKVIHQDNPEILNIEDNKFENIHCRHVLEHVTNPPKFLKEIYRVLKNNGFHNFMNFRN
jgi:ubiquinone/menaquinone biosynthesis C-methylase UbiE|tara:strand:- start:1499 stop:1870 length:372 start_codon:yes stop_codon:yes gene_type:complete